MSETQKAVEKARNAGRHLLSVTWPDSVPEEKRVPGPHHNPFDPRLQPDQHAAWLEGLRDALTGEASYNPATIVKQIDDELKVASHAG